MIAALKKSQNAMNSRVVIRALGDLPEFPLVSTDSFESITDESMIGRGTISDLGDSDVIQYGMCWSKLRNPTIADSKTTQGAKNSIGSFSSNITGLESGTEYFIRAYATNSFGTSYGVQMVIETL